jgi:hypothetical protein
MCGHDAVRQLLGFLRMMRESSETNFVPRRDWLGAALITAAVVGLHVLLLFHAGGFCGDEVQVINLAGTHSLSRMTHDSFPVLLPLVISGWSALGLGGSDFNLRLLGLLIGLGVVGALWVAAWTARRQPPLLSLIFFGLNGAAVFWTGYLRAYGLGTLLILLTLAAMSGLLARPTWRRTGGLTVAAVLSVQTLYPNAVFFAGICLAGWLVCWLRKDRSTAVKIFGAALLAAASLLPDLASIWKWQTATAVIRPGFSFTAVLDNLHTVLAFPLPQYVWIWLLLGLATLGLGVAAFFESPPVARSGERMTPQELKIFAGAILFFSLSGYLVFLYFAALITSPWYFLPLMALAATCFDLGIPLTSPPRLARTVIGGILIGTTVLAIPFAVRDLNCRFSNMDLVASRLMREISPQDYIVVTPWHLGISFNRYYHGAAAWDSLPPLADHSTYRFDLLPASADEKARAVQSVLRRLTDTLQNGHRVWIVGWMSIPAPGRKAATEEGRLLAEHSRSFEAVDLKIKGQTSDYEDVVLLRASGWQTNPP